MYYLIADESPERDAEWLALDPDVTDRTDLDVIPTAIVSWGELAEANDPETMDEIAALDVGAEPALGQCDPIRRLS